MVKGLVEALNTLWCYLFHRWSTYYEVANFDNAGGELVKRQRCMTCGRR